VRVETIAAPGLAERVEAGAINDDDTTALIDRYLQRVRDSGADVLALGCTHYAFLRDVIERQAGAGLAVIEPSEAVARQVVRVLESHELRNPRPDGGSVLYLTSGDDRAFAELRERLRASGADIPEPSVT
jgi:glutamate racemase